MPGPDRPDPRRAGLHANDDGRGGPTRLPHLANLGEECVDLGRAAWCSAFGEQARLKHSHLGEVLVAGRPDTGGHRLDLLDRIRRSSKLGEQTQADRAQAERLLGAAPRLAEPIPSRALASAAAGPRCSQTAPVRLP